MVKGIMKPLFKGFYSRIPELHWICEVCGLEFDGTKMNSWTMYNEHEIDCRIKAKNLRI